jgi:hypothetical protein
MCCNFLAMPFFLFVREALVALAPCRLLPPLMRKVGIASKEKKQSVLAVGANY